MGIATPKPDMVRPKEKRGSRRGAGFTLTEAMVVVTIIAITAGISAPAMYSAFAERRAASAPIDLVRLVRRARSESQAFGRAHLIRYSETAPGSFTLYRGISSSCMANTWSTLIAAGTGAGPCKTGNDSQCIDRLDLSASYYNHGALDIRATEAGGTDNIDLCFEPTGRTLYRTATADTDPFTDQNTTALGGGFLFLFQRYQNNAAVSVARRVVIPLGGDARASR